MYLAVYYLLAITLFYCNKNMKLNSKVEEQFLKKNMSKCIPFFCLTKAHLSFFSLAFNQLVIIMYFEILFSPFLGETPLLTVKPSSRVPRPVIGR